MAIFLGGDLRGVSGKQVDNAPGGPVLGGTLNRGNNVLRKLEERKKELSVLHKTVRILQDENKSEGELIQQMVNILPAGWQFPDITVVRISFGADFCQTSSFKETLWRQAASFKLRSGKPGCIEIYYLESRHEDYEGPFLLEERHLIDTLAETLRAYLQRKVDYKALQRAHARLEERVAKRTAELLATNVALQSEIEKHRKSREEITKHRQQLIQLTNELTLTEERERRVIASDLHDQIGQSLALIRSKILDLQGDAIFSGFHKNISAIMKLLEKTISSTRSLTFEISSPVLYELGMVPALRWIAERFKKKHDLNVTVIERGNVGYIRIDLRVMLFKCVRELLVNAAKYSNANLVKITVYSEDEHLIIEVADNGVGFDVAEIEGAAVEEKRFGLFSIKERLKHLGGEMILHSRLNRGTKAILKATLDSDR